MTQENEIITLLLGIGVMIFILANNRKVKRIPVAIILIAGFYVLLAGWVLTILEVHDTLNSFPFVNWKFTDG